MTTLTMHTTGLQADLSARTVSGLALPYNEVGRTNLGAVKASKDSGLALAERVLANLEHDGTMPLGKMVATEETPEGLRMTFSISKTSRGDDLLVEIDDGLRTGLSVEIEDPVIRAGALVGGTLSAVAFVTNPAFPSAQVSMTAADVGELPVEDEEEEDEELTAESLEITPATTVQELADAISGPTEDPEQETDQEGNPVTASATAATTLAAAAAGSGKQSIKTTREFVARLSAAKDSGNSTMLAALADVTNSAIGGDVSAQQFLGELWSGKGYQRVVVPLLKNGVLTSYSVKSWRWTKGFKPQVATYTGNKTDVPSNAVDTEAVTVAAERLAGAHDIDRKFIDFNDQDFLNSYLAAMTESYARKSDADALAFLQSSATVVAAGAVPSGISNAAAALVDGALAVLDAGVPTFAVVSKGAYRSLLLTPKDQVLELLSMSLGLEEGSLAGFKIVPRSDLAAGQVIVGVKDAAEFLELPGVPIRVDALDIAKGGFDTGLFGYFAEVLHNADGLASVSLAATTIDAGADFSQAVGSVDGSAGPTVWAVYSDGSRIDITAEAVLTSGTPAKATIVANKVHAVANGGSSVITATYQGKTDTVTATIT